MGDDKQPKPTTRKSYPIRSTQLATRDTFTQKLYPLTTEATFEFSKSLQVLNVYNFAQP